MFRRMGMIGAVVVVLAAAQGANAGNETITMRTQVHYSDLNLATPAGQAALRARLDSAAARSCGGSPVFDVRYREAPEFVRRQFELCRAEAIGRAQADLNERGIRVAFNR